jgi:hypothetical protein
VGNKIITIAQIMSACTSGSCACATVICGGNDCSCACCRGDQPAVAISDDIFSGGNGDDDNACGVDKCNQGSLKLKIKLPAFSTLQLVLLIVCVIIIMVIVTRYMYAAAYIKNMSKQQQQCASKQNHQPFYF